MINVDLLRAVDAFDENLHTPDYDQLILEQELLERSLSKLHELTIKTRMKKLMQEFGERDTDVYIVTFPKSGTTLMQMILYQLTTDGSMDFDHIYDVSPWCRLSAVSKCEMKSTGERRIIKTHDNYEMLKSIRSGKFICVLRDCADVVSSLHQHIKDYINPTADIGELWDRKVKDWLGYNMEWIKNEAGLPVLYINYEDIVQDKRAAILRIASFLGIEVDEARMERVTERSSIAFMKKHEEKFGEQPDHRKVYNNFIRNGRVGEGKRSFTEAQLEVYKALSEDYDVRNTPLARYFS
ncbi:MAG: sulfotransferase domain-containing protein [Sphingobacteriales bacterium]|nr:MAG: sulfotransferase domain-containing protein [Sphingobacteriales bacterium]